MTNESQEAKYTKGPDAAGTEKIPGARSQIDRFKSLHLTSWDSMPDLTDEEDARLLRARGGARGASEPSVVNKGLKQRLAIRRYLKSTRLVDACNLLSLPSPPILPYLAHRSGSLPTLPTFRSRSSLCLNGFSVTAEELEEMFQVCLFR